MCQNAATIDGHLKTSQSYLHEWFIKMILFIHKRNYVYIKYEKDYIFMNFLQGLHFSRTSLVCFPLYYFNNVPCHFPKFMILFIGSRYKCIHWKHELLYIYIITYDWFILQSDECRVQRNLAEKLINGWIELALIDELILFLSFFLFFLFLSNQSKIMIWSVLDECRTGGKMVMQQTSKDVGRREPFPTFLQLHSWSTRVMK